MWQARPLGKDLLRQEDPSMHYQCQCLLQHHKQNTSRSCGNNQPDFGLRHRRPGHQNDQQRKGQIGASYESSRRGHGFSRGLNISAFVRACLTQSVYIARNKSIKTQVLLFTDCGQAEEKALLDSGATENFIHPKLVLKHKLKKNPLSKPRTVRNINGTTNQMGKITHMVKMLVLHNNHIN